MGFEIPIGGDLTGLQAAFTKAVAEANTMGLDIARSLSKANQAAVKLHAGVGGIGREAGGSMAKAAGGMGMLARGIGALGPAIAGAAAALGGFAVARATIGGLTAAFDMGGQLSDLSARTGAAVADLVVLRQAFADAGVGADAVGPMINRLQKAIAGVNEDGQPTGKVLQKLGINLGELSKMGVMEQFAAIQKAISGITDPAQRSAAAMEIFGKSGGEMLALFADSGALSNAATNIGKQAQLLDRNAGNFDRISDLLGSASNKLKGFFVGMADRIAPVILPLLESFNKIDLSGFGQKVGDAFAMLAATFTSGRLSELAGTSLKLGFMESVNFLWGAFHGTISAAGQYLMEVFKTDMMIFQVMATPEFWSGVGNALTGVLLKAAEYFMLAMKKGFTVFTPATHLLDKMMGSPSQGAGADKTREFISGAAGQYFKDATADLAPAFDALTQRLGEAAMNIAAAYQAGSGKYTMFEGTGALRDQLAGIMADIRRQMEETAAAATKPAPTGAASEGTSLADAVSQRVAPQVMSLARVGGGGYGGPNVMNNIYGESRQQTRLLTKIADKLTNTGGKGAVYA